MIEEGSEETFVKGSNNVIKGYLFLIEAKNQLSKDSLNNM